MSNTYIQLCYRLLILFSSTSPHNSLATLTIAPIWFEMHTLGHLCVETGDHDLVVVVQHEGHVLQFDLGRAAVGCHTDAVFRDGVYEAIENIAEELLSVDNEKERTSSRPSSTLRSGASSLMYSRSFRLRRTSSGSGGGGGGEGVRMRGGGAGGAMTGARVGGGGAVLADVGTGGVGIGAEVTTVLELDEGAAVGGSAGAAGAGAVVGGGADVGCTVAGVEVETAGGGGAEVPLA